MSQGIKPKAILSLDIDFHESTHTRNVRSMSTRRLVTTKHDDLLRSGSTHQLLNRPYSGPIGGMPSLLAPKIAMPPPPPGAAASLATKETAEDTLSESGSDFSGGSFCEADGEAQADRDYLKKDLGASLHDDELDFNSGDEDGDDDLISSVKNRMKLDEAAK
jgi:hypothetical protein